MLLNFVRRNVFETETVARPEAIGSHGLILPPPEGRERASTPAACSSALQSATARSPVARFPFLLPHPATRRGGGGGSKLLVSREAAVPTGMSVPLPDREDLRDESGRVGRGDAAVWTCPPGRPAGSHVPGERSRDGSATITAVGEPGRDPRVDDRLHVLSGALRAFAEATTDYERLLSVVARTVSDVVADGCIVRLLSDGGWLTPVAFHFPLEAYVADANAAANARTFMTAPRNVAEYAWGQRLIETGEAFILPRLDIAQFRALVTPEVAKVYETIGIHSMLVVVLRLRGESIGTLTLFRFDPESPSFDAADQEMAQALADHASLAIGNARSYAAERAARNAAEKATARFSRLSEAGVIGTVVLDLADKRVVDVNDTLLHLVGYSRDELLSGRVPWASLTAPEWSDVDARAIEQLTMTGVAGLREKEFTRKDGTRVPVLAGSAMLSGGTTECISFVLESHGAQGGGAWAARGGTTSARDGRVRDGRHVDGRRRRTHDVHERPHGRDSWPRRRRGGHHADHRVLLR